MSLFWLIFTVAILAGMWKVFEKAGRQGWEGIVPVYNLWVLTVDILGKPWWWFVLLFVPIIHIIIVVLICIELAKRFGQGTGFAIGLFLLPCVFYPLLGFGEYRFS